MKYHIYKDTAGEFRWRLKSPNGKIVAVSGEGYVREEDCRDGIRLVNAVANTSEIIIDQREAEVCYTIPEEMAQEHAELTPEQLQAKFQEEGPNVVALIQSHLDGQPLTMAPEDGPKAGSAILTVLTVIGLVNVFKR